MMADEWGPWIDHDGGGCPCPGKIVHFVLGVSTEISVDGVFTRDPRRDAGGWFFCVIEVIAEDEAVAIAEPNGSWSWSDGCYPIVRYRIQRPAALRQLVDLAERLPALKPVEVA